MNWMTDIGYSKGFRGFAGLKPYSRTEPLKGQYSNNNSSDEDSWSVLCPRTITGLPPVSEPGMEVNSCRIRKASLELFSVVVPGIAGVDEFFHLLVEIRVYEERNLKFRTRVRVP